MATPESDNSSTSTHNKNVTTGEQIARSGVLWPETRSQIVDTPLSDIASGDIPTNPSEIIDGYYTPSSSKKSSFSESGLKVEESENHRHLKNKLIAVGGGVLVVLAATGTILGLNSSKKSIQSPPQKKAESSQIAIPTPIATPTPTETYNPPSTIVKEPLPQNLERLQSDTLEEFNNESWNDKLAYLSWLENQSGITPQIAASEIQSEKSNLDITDPLTVGAYPSDINPNNTPSEIFTINYYYNDVIYSQSSLLDAQKALNTVLKTGFSSPSWIRLNNQLTSTPWVKMSPKQVAILEEGDTTTIDSATPPTTIADGDTEITITWHGTATSGNGAITISDNGVGQFYLHTYKDFQGNNVTNWFGR